MPFQLLVIILFVLCFEPMTTIPMTIYNTASFNPTNITNNFISLVSVTTINACECQCYNNSLCVTGIYFGINQTCVLSSAHLSQGKLQLINNQLASVFSFINRTTKFDSIDPPAIMEWSFDNKNFDDTYDSYNGYFMSSNTNVTENSDILWVSPGYAGYGSAVHFIPNTYYVVDQYFTLTRVNFTISAWISIPFNFTTQQYDYFSLFSHCQMTSNDYCLHAVIGNDYLRFGFYGDDLIGNAILNLNQWYHVAYVYDRSASKQYVYLNGYLMGNRTTSASYAGNASQIILGPIPLIPSSNLHSGYIDKLTFVSRVKNGTELLNEATLVAYYPFNSSYLDAGPNNINNIIQVSTTFDSAGQFNQALVINSTNISYFQTTGFYYLGQSNYSYSFSLWIYPFMNNGTILQVSSSNGWCVPMIGFNESGYLTIQTLSINGIYAITYVYELLPLNRWTYVSMTYSLTFGIQLFVNGALVNYNNTFTDYSASGEMSTITIGTCLQPDICAVNQTKISPFQFYGKIDELKIFSRELSTNDIYQLMGSSENI